MHKMLLTVALVVSASSACAGEPVRLAQASGGLDATPPKAAEQRSLNLEPSDPTKLKMDPVEPPKSVESKPAETKAAEPVKAAERAPVETKSSESKSDSKPADAAKKKPVAKRRETDEEKARRIAKRYGVTW
jgi:type IV secretory pathway VirB10-like protein